jgi:hypothetical protein
MGLHGSGDATHLPHFRVASPYLWSVFVDEIVFGIDGYAS